MKKSVVLFFVVLLCICQSRFASAPANDVDVWKMLVDAELSCTRTAFQRWHVIQPVTLIAPRAGRDIEYSALASILRWQDSRLGDMANFNSFQVAETPVSVCLKRVAVWEEKLDKDGKRQILLQKQLESKGDVSDGAVLVEYLAGLSASPRDAARRYLEEGLLKHKAISQPVNTVHGKLLLDNGVLFMIKSEGRCFLCLGYAEGATQDLVLLADCAKVKTKWLNMAALDKSAEPWRTISEGTQKRMERLKSVGTKYIAEDEIFWARRDAKPDYVSLVPWPKNGEMYVICQPYSSYPLMTEFCKMADVATLSDDTLREMVKTMDADIAMQIAGAEKYRKFKTEQETKRVAEERAVQERRRKEDEWLEQIEVKNRADAAARKAFDEKRQREVAQIRAMEEAQRKDPLEQQRLAAVNRKMAAYKTIQAAVQKAAAAKQKNTIEGKQEYEAAMKECRDAQTVFAQAGNEERDAIAKQHPQGKEKSQP